MTRKYLSTPERELLEKTFVNLRSMAHFPCDMQSISNIHMMDDAALESEISALLLSM